jgi:mannan endo-1,4-beta-mannosidase
MQKQLLTSIFIVTLGFINAQHLQVNGAQLEDGSGNTIVLRGVNYPIIDDYNVQLNNYADVEHKIDQVALTGANCIRFPWYLNGTHYKDLMNPVQNPGYGAGTLEGYVNNGHLSHLLAYTFQQGMIPILEIHNLSGSDNYTSFQNDVVAGFWTDPAVLQVIDENKAYLIINLANEFGDVVGTANPTASLNTFKTNYITAISTIRTAGVDVPIMVDAPDWGQTSSELVNVANDIALGDPLSNTMFSVHAYWDEYANTQPAIATKLTEMVNSNRCFILGEVANTQAGPPTYSCGELDIHYLYPMVLEEACLRSLGWMAWSYDQDCDPTRELTTNGEFSNLTAWGDDFVNNANYGLKATNGCGASPITLNLHENAENELTVSPNPANNWIQVGEEVQSIELISLQGNVALKLSTLENKTLSLNAVSNGFYLIRLIGFNRIETKLLTILK